MDYLELFEWEKDIRSWPIAEKTWLVEIMQKEYEPMCQCYLLEGEKFAVAIDTGCGRVDIAQYMQTLTDLPICGVINTHSHFDHIGGNRFFQHVYASKKLLDAGKVNREQGQIEFFDPQNNVIWELPENKDRQKEAITFVKENDTLDLGNRELAFYEIGAHDAASIAILDRSSKMLFVGDEVETGWCNVGSIKREKCATIENHYMNMKKLKAISSEYEMLCPGHHGAPIAKECVDHQLMVDQIILNGCKGDENVPFTVAMGMQRQGTRVACYKTAHRGFCLDSVYNEPISEREIRNRELSRRAAREGIVLLKNNGVLPFSDNQRLALFGSGALYTSKGGTGSGDVNERSNVTIYEGLKNAGIDIINEDWLERYRKLYSKAREEWKATILRKVKTEDPRSYLDAYLSTPFTVPAGPQIDEEQMNAHGAQLAVYVLSRQAGEGADRREKEGDYYISLEEKEELSRIRRCFQQVVLLINSGGIVDLKDIDIINPDALLYISQPGMEGGNAVADILTGKAVPSGKLTDTWAVNYTDYPSAKSFNEYEEGTEKYEEGIYVGYRYFERFGVNPRVAFGYGLSYTKFSIIVENWKYISGMEENAAEIKIEISVTNVGNKYSGKEVVQIYASCPEGKLKKETKRLCAFKKTRLLEPLEKCKLSMSFSLHDLASFDESTGAYILEQGIYDIWVGDSSDHVEKAGSFEIPNTVELRRVVRICPLRKELSELIPPEKRTEKEMGQCHVLENVSAMAEKEETTASDDDIEAVISGLTQKQLILLANGDTGMSGKDSDTFGASGIRVPGSAGEISGCAEKEPWNIKKLVLADGPAGIRISQKYTVLKDGTIRRPAFVETLEHGLFAEPYTEPEGAVNYYQYCTSFPVGTMLAQTWDTELLKEVGMAVAEEMREYGIDIWLAPGMNIHRNPLCGRNYEYFSEDPYLSGKLAAAITNGVQSKHDVGTTIKHFACNQRENRRKQSDSVVSERALREIYLRGFEIAIKDSNPIALMTSYNLINGVHTANSEDLLTKVLRNEWHYEGLVISDWTTTGAGGSSPVQCIKAGNNLIMPGSEEDVKLIEQAVCDKQLSITDLNRNVFYLIKAVRKLQNRTV